MAGREPRLPVGGQTTTIASDDEAEAVRILCFRSRLYCRFSTLIPTLVGRGVHYRGGFQKFQDWSDKFSKTLLSAEYQTQRQSFLQLRGCRRLRSGAVLFSLYLFAQQLETQEYSDAHFDEEAKAAKKLRGLIEGLEQKAAPCLLTLKNAPGMWSSEAESISSMIQLLKETASEHGMKGERKSFNRNMHQLLLRLIVYLCGHFDTSRPKQTDIRSRVVRWITSSALGTNPGLDGEQGRSLAQIAASAAGTWISADALKGLYYEDRPRASEDIYQHYLDHR